VLDGQKLLSFFFSCYIKNFIFFSCPFSVDLARIICVRLVVSAISFRIDVSDRCYADVF